MFFPRPYRILAYKIMKRLGILDIKWLKEFMGPLKPTLKRSRLFVTIEEYIATAIFTILLTTPLTAAFIYFILTTLLGLSGVLLIVPLIAVIIIYIVIIFLSFFIYPSFRLNQTREDMEKNIPYAASHMATVAGSEVPLYKVFQTAGKFKEYGQVAEECERIAKNIEVFGYDPITAMSESAKQTPSPSFKDMLWGLVSIERTGGDIREFLFEKAEKYMEEQQDKQREYIDSLEIMAEVYTTVFVAGPILAAIMVTIMGTMGGLPISIRGIFTLLIYIGIPILSILYIIMLKGAKPETGA